MKLEEAAAHHVVDMVSRGELRIKRHASTVSWKHSGAANRQRQTAD